MRILSFLAVLVVATPAMASNPDFCALGYPKLGAEAEAARALVQTSDDMARPMLDSGMEAALKTLEGELDGDDLSTFVEYVRSYENLRPMLLEYIDKLDAAAMTLGLCALE